MKYRRDIDGLRALAVLPVVLFHAKAPGFSGGFVGVDVFFVISGYLITGLIAEDWRESRFSFVTFYFRRAKRILPALFCVYLACAVLAALIMLPSDMAEFGRSLASSAAFVSNHFFYRLADYFGGQSDLKPLLHTWSLSIEEQFYVVWPVVFLIVARWRSKWLPNVVWTIGGISLAAAAIVVGQHKEAAFFFAPFRVWELLLGAALALLAWRPALSTWVTETAAAIGLALIVASIVLLDESQPFPGLLALPACLGTALLILAGMSDRPLVTRALSLRLPVAIGLVSYSLYLWHWPLLAFARYHYDRPLQFAEVAGVLGTSLLLSVLTYRYVETPARHLSINLAPRVVGAGVLSLAAIALAGHQINKSRGWTFSLDPEIRQLDRISRTRNPYRNSCGGADNVFRKDDACTFGAPRGSRSYDMAIFGDSHADHYTPAMAVLAEKARMSGRQITVGRCLMLIGYHEMTGTTAMQSACRALREAMLRFVQENPGLQVAVLAQHWSSYTGREIWQDVERIHLLGEKDDTVSEQRTQEVLRQSLDATLDYFGQRGIRVILLGEVPLFDRDPIRCLAGARRQGQPAQSCRIAASDVQRRVGEANALLADIAARRNNVSFYSPLQAMCDKEWCSAFLDSVYMYRDRMHLNRVGAEHLAKSMPDLGEVANAPMRRPPPHAGSTDAAHGGGSRP